MKILPCLLRPGFGFALVLGMAMAAAGIAGNGTARAQSAGPCSLLTVDEIQPLAPKQTTIANGVPSAGTTACQYTWGEGVNRFKLDVIVNEPRMSADAVKQGLQSVQPGTADSVVQDVGEAAVFRADSSVLAHATAYLKGRLLQVRLDGYEAREKKDQVIALLKSAASRL
jgi:hypothetical protein